MPVTLICEWCTEPYHVKPSRQDHSRFCCQDCQTKARHVPVLIAHCPECGEEFPLRGNQRYTPGIKYCSNTCAMVAIGRRKRGAALHTFWDRVQRCEHEEWCPYCCFPWTGAKHPISGYGRIIINGREDKTHRIAWELFHDRSLRQGMHVAHYCHNPICSNPIHLHEATPMENIQDSVRDLRHTFGARNGMSTLTETTALYALALRTLGWSYQRIATHLGVGHGAVEKVCTGQRWRHLRIPSDLRTTILQKALSQGPSTCILFK